MTPPDASRVDALLSESLRAPVRMKACERLAPWYVFRCHLDAPTAGVPKSVICKRLRDDPDGFRIDPSQVSTEKAALEFLDELGLALAPRLLAGDLEAGILVLEDLAPRSALSDALALGGVALGKGGLRAFARAVGELHAGTVGRADAYDARRRALGSIDPRIERERFMGWGWNETRGYTDALGVALSTGAESERARVQAALAEPGPFLAFSNGDSGTNNFLVDGRDGRIIDWEFAGFRHALTDVACLHVPGPMWITVADPIAAELEAEYRRVLAQAVPQAGDDGLFGSAMAAACMAMAVERLHRLPKVDARAPGDDSRVQMISTLESAAEVAARHGALPRLAGWARAVAATLRRRWPDADVDLSSYRAYTRRR